MLKCGGELFNELIISWRSSYFQKKKKNVQKEHKYWPVLVALTEIFK